MHHPIDVESVVYQCSLAILKQLRLSRQPIQPGETEWLERILSPFAKWIDLPEFNRMADAVAGLFEIAANYKTGVAAKLGKLWLVYPQLVELLDAIIAGLPRNIPSNGSIAMVKEAVAECQEERRIINRPYPLGTTH